MESWKSSCDLVVKITKILGEDKKGYRKLLPTKHDRSVVETKAHGSKDKLRGRSELKVLF